MLLIILQWRPIVKFNIRKRTCTSDDQWISMPQVHTPRCEYLIDDYSQRYLALSIPDSKLNTRNAPGTRPYCNFEPLKKFTDQMKLQNLTSHKFFTWIIFNVKIPHSTIYIHVASKRKRTVLAIETASQGCEWMVVVSSYARSTSTCYLELVDQCPLFGTSKLIQLCFWSSCDVCSVNMPACSERAHTSVTALHTCVCLLVSLDRWLTEWAHSDHDCPLWQYFN